jgi:HAE1 family hydrophobic/amphiphilic exporter-1
MTPAKLAIQRPVTTVMVFLSMVVIGLIASRLLPLEYFPAVDVPVVVMNIPYQGSTPEEVEREITRPAEEVLATLSGIERLESSSSANGSQIELIFKWGTDTAIKAVEARERVEAIRDQLPSDLRRINVFKFNFTDQPVLTLRISSERDLSAAYDMLMRKLVRPLERIDGVARVDFQGIEPREIRIELIADRVVAHGIDLADLQRRLQQVNFSDSAGLIKDGDTRYRVNPRGEYQSIDEISELVITDDGLRLRDIAEVRYTSARRSYARHLDQKYAVGVSIFKETNANLVDVGERVIAAVEAVGQIPEMRGINLVFLENQAEGVKESLRELLGAGLIGMLLSLFVLYFFMRNVVTTLMVSLAVPVSIIIALGVMYFIGITLNILSMMGLMLAVGMLVDNAVVITESIQTERDRSGQGGNETIIKGVSAVSLAVAAGTLTSAAVFLPIIFGEPDQISIFLTHVAAAIVVSLAVSLMISQTVIPMISSRIHPPKKVRKNILVDRMRERYVRILHWTFDHRWWSALGIVIALASAAVPMSLVDTDMFPQAESRRLFMPMHLDANYPLAKVKESVDRIENFLYANQERFEIRNVYTYYNEDGQGQILIYLTDDSEAIRSSEVISEEILEEMPKIAIGAPSFEWNRSGGGESLSVTLTGGSSEVLRELGEEVERVLVTIEGISGASSTNTAGEAELHVKVDREKANQLGFSTAEVAQAVAIAVRGVDLREFKGEEGEIPIRLQFRETDRAEISDLRDLKLRNSNGDSIPIMALVDVAQVSGPTTIRRLDRQTGLRITASLEDLTAEDARELIEAKLDALTMPPGYDWKFGGGFDDDQEAMQKMMFNILLGVAIIYIVLAAQFESLLYPATMITTILFSVIGVYWFFLLTGTTFTLMAMIGILILIGVVVNNGIVMIDHINQLRLKGMDRDHALIEAGRERLRPILMTVGTTVLGLLPLCIGNTQIGGDGPPYFPMARAIVGGLLFSTFVSLLFLPTIYMWLDVMRHWPRKFFHWLGPKLFALGHHLTWPIRKLRKT